MAVKSEEISRSNSESTPQKRGLRSNADLAIHESPISSPLKRKSPRRCVDWFLLDFSEKPSPRGAPGLGNHCRWKR
ncbi:hypothetical protein Peur_074203 [Populus x canadensis]